MKQKRALGSSSVTVLNGSVAIAAAIKRVMPKRIAVAYLGNDVLDMIPAVEDLDSVIIWPASGTEPQAVRELAERLGNDWSKVHLHQNMHAKIYLGNDSAIVGSANWTVPGLRSSSREEVCLEVTDPVVLAELENVYKKLTKQARLHFRNEKEKINKLNRLQVAIDNGLPSSGDRSAVNFLDYVCDSENVFLLGWSDEIGNLSASISDKEAENIKAQEELPNVDSIEYFTFFGIKDEVKLGDWVFVWPREDANSGSSRNKISNRYWWMKVDRIVKNANNSRDYPHLAYMHPRGIKERLNEAPFKITNDVVAAFHEVVSNDGKLKSLVLQTEDKFLFKKLTKHIPTLVDKMKKAIRPSEV